MRSDKTQEDDLGKLVGNLKWEIVGTHPYLLKIKKNYESQIILNDFFF